MLLKGYTWGSFVVTPTRAHKGISYAATDNVLTFSTLICYKFCMVWKGFPYYGRKHQWRNACEGVNASSHPGAVSRWHRAERPGAPGWDACEHGPSASGNP